MEMNEDYTNMASAEEGKKSADESRRESTMSRQSVRELVDMRRPSEFEDQVPTQEDQNNGDYGYEQDGNDDELANRDQFANLVQQAQKLSSKKLQPNPDDGEYDDDENYDDDYEDDEQDQAEVA